MAGWWKIWGFLSSSCSLRWLCRPFSSAASSAIAINRVTRSSFDTALEELRRHIQAADFISIDLEMSGLTSSPWRDSFEFDRVDIRYLKVKDSAEKFAVVQCGICPFRWDASKSSFIAHPHSFYIFRRKELPVKSPSYEFACQTSSLSFLANHLFDFNTCILEGLSYLSRAEEAEAREILQSTYDAELDSLKDVENIPLMGTFDVLFTERMKRTFQEWRDGLLGSPTQEDQFPQKFWGGPPKLCTAFFKLRPAVMLNGFTSHQFRLIKLVTKKYFKDLTYVNVADESSSDQRVIVYTDSEADKALLLNEIKNDLHARMEGKVKAAVGFRHVIDILVSEKKLVVGHNCFLDMAHIFYKFFGCLPSSIEEFASSIHDLFPLIIDTKNLLKSGHEFQEMVKTKKTSLSCAFAQLCPHIAGASAGTNSSTQLVKVEVPTDEMRLSTWSTVAKHDAGYDAFMTGCVFAQACIHLGIDFHFHAPSPDFVRDERLQKYMNHLCVSWSNGHVIDLSTGSTTSESCSSLSKRYQPVIFSRMVVIWQLPAKLKPKELRECLIKAFGPFSVISIYYLDESTTFVQFNKEELVSGFLIAMDALEKRKDPIVVLHPLMRLLEGGTTRAAGYELYKQICTSPLSKFTFSEQAHALGVGSRESCGLKVVSKAQESVTGEERTALNPICKSVQGLQVMLKDTHALLCEQIVDASHPAENLCQMEEDNLVPL